MPRIFDNISLQLLPDLQRSLAHSDKADLCVGYFNLRGWQHLGPHVEHYAGGEGGQCRIIVGMHRSESAELKDALRLDRAGEAMDMGEAARLTRQLAEEFKEQLTLGFQRNDDERALQLLGYPVYVPESRDRVVIL